MQLFGIMFSEMIFYSLNFWINVDRLKAVDMGGSIVIHTFGAYFGLAVTRVLSGSSKKQWRDRSTQGSTTGSDTFAMIGTLFLWMFWPSFNGALAVGASRHRVIINTVLALTGSCIASFAMSGLLRPGRKFSMVDIQNATLAGGVAVGSSADLVIKPYGALLVGVVAGTVSVLGYVYLLPYLERKINLHDTAGVNNLHGMPGLIGGIGGAVAAATTKDKEYGEDVSAVYPAVRHFFHCSMQPD
jgi:ammonium transporter Rh